MPTATTHKKISAAVVALTSLASALTGCSHASAPRPASSLAAARPPKANPSTQYSASDLESYASAYVQGYEPEQTLSAQLDGFAPVPLEMKRGRCYRLVFRFGPDATLSATAQRHLTTSVATPDGNGAVTSSKVHGPGGVAPGGCPQRSGTATIALIPAGSHEAGDDGDLGRGAVSFQVFSKPISDAALAANVADDARQDQAAQAFSRNDCSACRREKDLCLDGKRAPLSGSCVADFDSCRFTRSVPKGTCD